MARIAMAIATQIHTGDNTHHHDQPITPQSFRTMNATVRRPTNPIPPLFELLIVLLIGISTVTERIPCLLFAGSGVCSLLSLMLVMGETEVEPQ